MTPLKILPVSLGIILLTGIFAPKWSRTWISACEEKYIIVVHGENSDTSITFYGKLLDEKKRQFYYRAEAVDLSLTDSSLSFHLEDFYFSKQDLYTYPHAKKFRNNDMEMFYTPNMITGNIKDNTLAINLTKHIYFSRFDTCTFRLKDQ